MNCPRCGCHEYALVMIIGGTYYYHCPACGNKRPLIQRKLERTLDRSDELWLRVMVTDERPGREK